MVNRAFKIRIVLVKYRIRRAVETKTRLLTDPISPPYKRGLPSGVRILSDQSQANALHLDQKHSNLSKFEKLTYQVSKWVPNLSR